MSTALQLVNRVRRQIHEEDTTVFTDELSKVILDFVNEGIHRILESRTWDFDKRQDNVLKTTASFTGTDATVTNDSTSVTLPNVAIGAVTGDFVGRIVITDDASYGDTAFRVASAVTSGSDVVLTLATAFPGTTQSATAEYTFLANEYVLPSTIRAVTSVRYQQNDDILAQIGRELGMDWVSLRPHEDISDEVEAAYIGSTLTKTFDSGSASSGETGMGLQLHPTPSSALVLHYGSIYRHADLSATTDTLDDVDAAIEDLIVRWAYAQVMTSGVGNEPQIGTVVMQEVLRDASDLFKGHPRDPFRRRRLLPSFPTHGAIRNFGRLPRNVGSI